MRKIFKEVDMLPSINQVEYKEIDIDEGTQFKLAIKDIIDIERNVKKCKVILERSIKDENDKVYISVKVMFQAELIKESTTNDEILKYIKKEEFFLDRAVRLVSITISQITVNTGFRGIVTAPELDDPEINIFNSEQDN